MSGTLYIQCIGLLEITIDIIVVSKTTAAQNGVALSYHKVRGLYFLAVGFVRSMLLLGDTLFS